MPLLTLKQMLNLFRRFQNLTKDVPTALTEAQVRARAADPVLTRRREQADAYHKHLQKQKKISTELSKKYFSSSNLDRYVVHYMNVEDTPEAAEYNDDLQAMLYTPEGKQALAGQVIRNVLAQDFSVCYAGSVEEAFDAAVGHQGMADQMFIAQHLLEGNSYTIDPLVAEQLENAKVALQSAGLARETIPYYAGAKCVLFSEEVNPLSNFQVRKNIDDAKKTKTPIPEHFATAITEYFDSTLRLYTQTPEYKETVRQLKEQGIIGPDSMYWRAFDENGKRMTFDKAVTARAEGKKVMFIPLTPDEQAKLREALKNPVKVEKTNPGPLYGKEFRDMCKEMYHALDGADRTLVRSSAAFRTLKQTLKDMAENPNIPNRDEAKKFLREAVQQTSAYLKSKTGGSENLSEYAKKRLNVVRDIHRKLSVKLGTLAYEDYKIKQLGREAAERNQARMTEALEARARLEAQIKAPPVVRDIVVDEKDKGTPFENLVKQANISMRKTASAIRSVVPDPAVGSGRYLAMMLAYNLVVAERKKIEAASKNEEPAEELKRSNSIASPEQAKGADELHRSNSMALPNSGGVPESDNIGPFERLLNKVGSKAFYKGVQNSSFIQKMVKDGITTEKIRVGVRNGIGPRLVNELSKPENRKEIIKEAEKYHEAQKPVVAAPKAPVK